MKKILLLSAIATSMILCACDKDKSVAAPDSAAKAASAPSASAKAVEKPRLAVYDANLKPAEIVWDSPEKKKQWEARQAQLLQGAKAASASAPASK